MTEESNIDAALLEKFEKEVLSQVPHREEKDGKVEIVNATPVSYTHLTLPTILIV